MSIAQLSSLILTSIFVIASFIHYHPAFLFFLVLGSLWFIDATREKRDNQKKKRSKS